MAKRTAREALAEALGREPVIKSGGTIQVKKSSVAEWWLVKLPGKEPDAVLGRAAVQRRITRYTEAEKARQGADVLTTLVEWEM